MQKTIIDDALDFARAVFKDDRSGHDYYHTLRVYKMAVRIARQESANLLTVSLASLLHDVDDIKLSPQTSQGKDRAAAFLREHGVAENSIKIICGIIGEVSFKAADSVIPRTIEGRCVQDADRLDAIGAIGIARAFAYGASHNRVMHDPDLKPEPNMSADDYLSRETTTINHFYEKLLLLEPMMGTVTARKIARQRQEYMKSFVQEFLDEWDGLR